MADTASTRGEALSRGLKVYDTGRPCRHGHVGPRRASNGACVACDNSEVRLRLRRAYAANPERFKRYRLRQKSGNPAGVLLRSARQRARKRGIPFDLEPSDVVVPETCPCCTKPIVASEAPGPANSRSPSLDRINPDLGYVRGNVAVICWRCNNLKRDATSSELRAIAEWMEGQLNVAQWGERAAGNISAS